MSSRALKKLQNHQAEAQNTPEPESDASEHETQHQTQKAFNAFDLLNDSEDDGGDEHHAFESEAEPVTTIKEEPAHAPEASEEKKKKKKKKKKQKSAKPAKPAKEPEPAEQLDEIDLALKELSMRPAPQQNAPTTPSVPSSESEALCSALAIEQRNLNALNEMKKLFGSIAVEINSESDEPRGGGRRRDRQRIVQLDLGRALTGRYSPASRGLDLTGSMLRKNALMPGKDEWPRAPSGGLAMELVEKRPSGVTEYKLVHNTAYKDVQRQFDMCVDSMDPQRLIELLQFNPYHLSTLLQVSEIAKHQGDHAVAADLLERALFNIGRSAHTSFGNLLKEGKTRMSFKVSENREVWLTGWSYIANLGMKGTWKTAYQWAKLLLSLEPNDPYVISLAIDSIAIRGREHQNLITLSEQPFFAKKWDLYPNIQSSLALAYNLSGNTDKARQQMRLAVSRYPWIFCRLCQELNINPIPKNIWGALPPDQPHELYTTLYITRAKDLWNTPEATSFIVTTANSLDKTTPQTAAPAITRDVARHVLLSGIPAAVTHVPRNFFMGPISASDPLPPGESSRSRALFAAMRNETGVDIDMPTFERFLARDDAERNYQAPDDQGAYELSSHDARVLDRLAPQIAPADRNEAHDYLMGDYLDTLRDFFFENGVDPGNWGENADGGVLAGWVDELRYAFPPHEREPLIRQAADRLGMPMAYDELMDFLEVLDGAAESTTDEEDGNHA